MMQTLWQDLRYGARMLLKQKGVTAIAVLSLALGIGANTALFSVVDAMLLKLLPVREPERLALFPYVSYQRMREQQRERQGALSDVFAFTRFNVNLQADGQADVVNGQVVTGNYHLGLGLRPLLGRLLTD